MPAWVPDGGLIKFNKITDFAYYVLRVAISRLCPAGPPGQFQAAPLRTPAAICQNCGLPPIARPVAPGLLLMSLFLFAKLPLFSLTAKKNKEIFKKYLISLILNELQVGIFRGFPG